MLVALSLLACTPEKTDKSDSAPPLDNSDTADCGGTLPVVSNLVAADGGPIEDSDGGGQQPSIKVEWDMDDDDHDLNTFSWAIWYQLAATGAPDTASAPYASSTEELSDGACTSGQAHYGLKLGVNGGAMEYATAYTFTVIVEDMAGLASEAVTATGTTPGPL